MPTQYGDTIEPGVITEESSTISVQFTGESPSVTCVVGPADVANATNPATEGEVYQILRASTAERRFGPDESSLLTTAVTDQLREGASPVFAVAAPSTEVTSEDHSSSTQKVIDLNNEPVSENASDYTFTLDGSDLSVNVVHTDVTSEVVSSGEAYVNSNTARVKVSSAPADGTGFTADYTHYDYETALNNVEDNQVVTAAMDFLVGLQENPMVQQYVVDTAVALAGEQYYCMAQVAPNTAYIDPSSVANPYENSRVQVNYPTRFEDGSSALAAVVGLRASLGLGRTPIRQSLATNKSLNHTLSKTERATLIDKKIVPLKNAVTGAVVTDDPTTAGENTADANINYSFKRLALDYIYETVEANEEPFIGRLNTDTIRNALGDLISDQLKAMKDSQIVDSYSVNVFEQSSTRARVEVDIDAPEPLRFVTNDVRVGDIN